MESGSEWIRRLQPQRTPDASKAKTCAAIFILFVILILITLLTDPLHAGNELSYSETADAQFLAKEANRIEEYCSTSERADHAQYMCDVHEWASTKTNMRSNFYRRIIADDHNNVLYCADETTGAILFEHLFMNASERIPVNAGVDTFSASFMQASGLRFLDEYDTRDINDKLLLYHKVLVVMNPIERLRTHLMRLVARNNAGIDNAIHDSTAESDLNGSTYTPTADGNLTFSTFVQSVIEGELGGDLGRPIYELCHPCDIAYDRIIKKDSIERDVRNFLQEQIVNTTIYFDAATVNKLNRAPSVISIADIPRMSLLRLQQIYSEDMDLFGYSWSTDQVTCRYPITDGFSCC